MNAKNIDTVSLDGGCLCFDFINTVNSWEPTVGQDYLVDFEDFIKFLRRRDRPVTDEYAAGLMRLYKKDKELCETFLDRIKVVRSFLYNFFAVIAENKLPDEDQIATFNELQQEMFKSLKTDYSDEGLKSKLIFVADLSSATHPIIKSAYDILNNENLSKIKSCPECGWLFLDMTKNQKKIYCNPQYCGSAVKMRKYYKKKRNSGLSG